MPMLPYQSLRMFQTNNNHMRKISALYFLLTISLLGNGQYTSADSIATRAHVYHWKNFVLPVSLVGLGIYGALDNHVLNVKEIREERTEHFPNFSHNADNYFQFAPVSAVVLMNAM